MISFTQYMRPYGKKVLIEIDRPAHIELKANALIQLGFKFEIEVMMTGMVSMTIEGSDVDENGPLNIKLCQNGPQIPIKVDELISEAYEKLKAKGVLQ